MGADGGRAAAVLPPAAGGHPAVLPVHRQPPAVGLSRDGHRLRRIFLVSDLMLLEVLCLMHRAVHTCPRNAANWCN